MPKKNFIYFILFFLVVSVAIVLVKGLSNEDDWTCQGGQWVKHGNPSAFQPTQGCGEALNAIQPDIVIYSPLRGQTIQSPLAVKGKARGNWYFEAVFPIRLLDDKGNELAAGQARATGDWMTEQLVPFEASISFNPGSASMGTLILKNDNPSGMPEKEKQASVPVNFNSGQTTKIKIYFNNSKLDPEASCNKAFAAERDIPKTSAVGRAALEELLKGPTATEKDNGFFTSINSGVKIQSLSIENGVAKVDFDEQLEAAVGGSCRVAAIRAQITQTLKQFPTVKEVIISINGRTEDILQP